MLWVLLRGQYFKLIILQPFNSILTSRTFSDFYTRLHIYQYLIKLYEYLVKSEDVLIGECKQM